MTGDEDAAEVARLFTANLQRALGHRDLGEAARHLGLSRIALRRLLDGQVRPDLFTIAHLEHGLGVDLWPGRPPET